MTYNRLTNSHIEELFHILGKDNIIHKPERMADYTHDEFPYLNISSKPDVVVFPKDVSEVSEIMRFATRNKLPVTPRGAGTGLVGGCVPIYGGILLVSERLNKLYELDKENLMATVDSGVRLRDFYNFVEKGGLFFPPHPGDDSATIGGVIATSAGGMRATKYGIIRNFVRAIEVVLPNGEVLKLGGKFLKSSSGLNLLQLFIGSEGTLGIITKATLSLMPIPKKIVTLLVPFSNVRNAVNCVTSILSNGLSLMAMEFIDMDTIEFCERKMQKAWPLKKGEAQLLMMVDAQTEAQLVQLLIEVERLCKVYGAEDIFLAESSQKQKDIISFRSQMYEALRPVCYEVLDIVLPRDQIPGHIEAILNISKRYNIWLPTYGHAGDGNVHTHITRLSLEKKERFLLKPKSELDKVYSIVREELHKDASLRGGLVSGEHGIGIAKAKYLHLFLDKTQISLMRSIKKVFDPNLILNPGKIFP